MGTLPHERAVLALLVDALEGTYQSTILTGAADACREHDVGLLCVAGGELSLTEPTARNTVYALVGAHNVDAVMLMTGTLGNVVGHQGLEKFIAQFRGMPICSIAVELEGAINVLVDNARAIRDAVAHLVHDSGRRTIAFIRGPAANEEAVERFEVYREELARHGIAFDPRLVVDGDFSRASGEEAIHTLWDARGVRPDAIVAADDVMALGAMDGLFARGLRVPEDVALMGFNDIEEARFAAVPLTTVRQPLYEQGKQAVRATLAALRGAAPTEPVILATELIKRRSSDYTNPNETSGIRGLTDPVGQTFAEAFAGRRPAAISEMERAIRGPTQTAGPGWAARLVDAFTLEISGRGEPGMFDRAVRDVVGSSLHTNADGGGWQEVISVLRREALPCLGRSGDERLRAENLWQIARTTIAELVERAQVHQRLQVEGWARSLGQTTAALISSFDVMTLVNAMAEQFPRLSIASCYLSMFNPTDFEHAELLLAHDARRPEVEVTSRIRFESRFLAPPSVLPREPRVFVLEPLLFQQHRLGFAMFEYGPREGIIYEALRDQISASLKGAMLVQEVIEKDRERELLMRDLEQRARQLERAYKALQEGQRRLLISETMASIGQMTARVRPLGDLFHDILTQLTGLLGGEHAFIAVAPSGIQPPSENMIVLPGPGGLPDLWVRAGIGRFDDPGVETPLGAEQTNLLLEAYASGRSRARGQGVAIPLRAGGEPLGMLYLERSNVDEHELELLATFSTQATVAIQNAQLYQMAALDPLTEVHARRFFDQWLPREVQGAFTGRRPLSVLMVDMDQMKRINDTGGHLAGDQALVTVGKVLREATRDHDVIARYGGDEFALILPNTDAIGAEVVGLRILDLAAQHTIPRLGEPLRCSVGASTLEAPRAASTPTAPLPTRVLDQVSQQLIGNADAALYQAKSRGGACMGDNTATFWPEEALHP